MNGRYVEPRASRVREEIVDGVERLRLPPRRMWFAIAFLPFWLAGWTVGGIAALYQLKQDFSAFLVFWLCGWAVGWIFAASTLGTQLFGREIISTEQGDLIVLHGIGPLTRQWRYRGSDIRALQRWDVQTGWPHYGWQTPLGFRSKTGSVRFDYGADSIFFGSGIDGPDADQVVGWLTRRLPRTATAPD